MKCFSLGHFCSALAPEQALAGMFAFVVFLAAATPGHATPVTFRFEAEVKSVPHFNDDLGLPVLIEEGSVISGIFTFDPDLASEVPDSNAAVANQPYSMRFEVDGTGFILPRYRATAINDSVIIGDDQYSGPAEFVRTECFPHIESCEPGTVQTASGDVMFYAEIDFAGRPGIMSSPGFSNKLEFWNAFDVWRDLQLLFVSEDGSRSASFDAEVGRLNVVPEPAITLLLALGCLLFASVRELYRCTFPFSGFL